MRTKRLRVRRFLPKDGDALFRLLSDKDTMRYLEAPYSREKSDAFLKAVMSENPPVYAVEDGEGFAGYMIWHPWGGEEKESDVFELGWVILPDRRGRGYARELTEAAAARGHRAVIIECAPGQSATKKIAEACGFTYRGRADGCDIYRREKE